MSRGLHTSSTWITSNTSRPTPALTWLDDVHLPGVGGLGVDPNICYRAMDWLLAIEDELAESVYWAVADLLDLEVDVLLFDYPADPGSGSALTLAA